MQCGLPHFLLAQTYSDSEGVPSSVIVSPSLALACRDSDDLTNRWGGYRGCLVKECAIVVNIIVRARGALFCFLGSSSPERGGRNMKRLTALLRGLAAFVALAILTVLLIVLFSQAGGSWRRSSPTAGEAAATETATQPAFQSPVETPIGPIAQMPTPTQTPADRTFQSPVQTPTASPTPWPTPTPRPEPGLVGLVQDVAISPDGQQVLFISQQSRAGNWGVYALSLDDDQIRPFLQRGGEIRPNRVDWSPDGRTVAIATWTDRRRSLATFHDIYVTGADGRQLSNLTANLDEVIEDWTWSPDSQSIACITEPKDRTDPLNLWICRVDTLKCVRYAVTAYSVSGNAKGYLAWSPDSTKLAVGYEPGVASGMLVLVGSGHGLSTTLCPSPRPMERHTPSGFPTGRAYCSSPGRKSACRSPCCGLSQ